MVVVLIRRYGNNDRNRLLLLFDKLSRNAIGLS